MSGSSTSSCSVTGQPAATNLEISTNYEAEAAQLLERTGMAARVERRFLDIAQVPDEVERADVVVLHRVVCCYPDYERLLGAAASKTGRLLVFSHPPGNLVTRAVFCGGEQPCAGSRATASEPSCIRRRRC